MHVLHFASHTAHVDDLAGCGLLRLPAPGEDLRGPLLGESLHGADWADVVRFLAASGWEPSEDEHGDLVHEGYTTDGREVVALCRSEGIPAQRGGAEASRDRAARLAALRLATGLDGGVLAQRCVA